MKKIVSFCILMLYTFHIHTMKRDSEILAPHALLLPADVITYIEAFCDPVTRTQWPFVNTLFYTCASLIKKKGDILLHKDDRLFYLFFGSIYNLPNLIYNTLNHFDNAYTDEQILLQEACFYLKDLVHTDAADALTLIPSSQKHTSQEKSVLSWIIMTVNDRLKSIENKLVPFAKEHMSDFTCLALVKLLLKFSQLYIPDEEGKNALYYAIESIKNLQEYYDKKHIGILKLLIKYQEKAITTGTSSLSFDLLYQEWFKYSDFEITKILLTYALVPNINTQNMNKETKLHNNANNDITKFLLIQPTIDINIRNLCRETPLIKAVYYGWIEKTKLLLADPRTEVNAQNCNGNTPLHLAVQAGSIEIVKLLLANKRIESLRNEQDLTPLMCSLNQLQILLADFNDTTVIRERNVVKKEIKRQSEINTLLMQHFFLTE